MRYYNAGTNNDKWIVEVIFPGKRGGYFIEAGAANGKKQSSCYVLEKELGWTGICVEPNDLFFKELVENRSDSICENLCLSNRTGKVIYIEGSKDMVSPYLGGIKENLIKFRRNGKEVIEKGKEIEKEAITIFDLLRRHNAPKVIEYIALDIEGSELPVLEVFPFAEYKVLAFSVEGKQCNNLLVSQGYREVKNPFNSDKLFEQYFLHETII